jgi:hypothetical protein
MEQKPERRMTFKNSFWQCLVALILWYPLAIVITTILAIIFNLFGLSGDQITATLADFSYVIALGIQFFLVRWDVYRRIAKKNKAL